MADDKEARQHEEDLILRFWEGDESALAELACLYGPRIEKAIRGRFQSFNEHDAEDVVAEAIRRFWAWRARFDPAKARVGTVLYKFATNVARERRACRRRWEKAHAREEEYVDAVHESLRAYDTEADREALDPEPPSALLRAVAEIKGSLLPLEREIWEAYADAGDTDLNAGQLGIELGAKHNDGVPIPAGTIRVTKHRAKEKILRELAKRGFDLKTLGLTND